MEIAIKFSGLLTEWAEWARDLFVISCSQIIGLVIAVVACGAGASYALYSWPILHRAQIREAPPLSCKSQIREAPNLSLRQRERARHRWKWAIRSVIRAASTPPLGQDSAESESGLESESLQAFEFQGMGSTHMAAWEYADGTHEALDENSGEDSVFGVSGIGLEPSANRRADAGGGTLKRQLTEFVWMS